MLTEAMPMLISVIFQAPLTTCQRAFPIREVTGGIFEQICYIGLKRNRNFSRRSQRNTGEKCIHEEGQQIVEF